MLSAIKHAHLLAPTTAEALVRSEEDHGHAGDAEELPVARKFHKSGDVYKGQWLWEEARRGRHGCLWTGESGTFTCLPGRIFLVGE